MVVEFEEWFGAELPRLLRFTTVLCGSPDLAEDLVQDVLVKVQQRWPKLSRLHYRDAYIRRMLINQHLSFRRTFGRVVPRATIEPDQDDRPLFADQHADRESLIGQLSRLPPRQRTVLVLRYYDDADDATIARILGCRPSTVRAYAARALQTLRISPVFGDPSGTDPTPHPIPLDPARADPAPPDPRPRTVAVPADGAEGHHAY